MNYETFKNKVEKACNEFNVPMCKLELCHSRVAYYLPELNTIRINPRNNHSCGEYSLIHEFAHHLTYAKEKNRSHDFRFMLALMRAIKWYYGNYHDYPWHLEYDRLQSWYKAYANPNFETTYAKTRKAANRKKAKGK